MKLSIVIVNYNVKFFLEQCLISVFHALKGIEAEVFVVDNDSVDGSAEMVRQKFPQVILIANKKNVGFAVANNQAIRKASGQYVLLLNPDTVVEEETFAKSMAFMDNHPDAGALGVKMMDGKGNFLPESKRGLPTPWVAFYKIFGWTTLFPRSKKFARYYMGHLDKDANHEVEVLAGAYMLMRQEALDKSGLLDETFFMYGEDIDLSYRITKAGYKNYYLADTSIIHYKGESTKKGSLNYVYIFYKAMIIFAEKHFSSSYARFFRFFILMAIYFRAALSLVKRMATALALPLLDAVILVGGLFYIKEYWENNHRFIVGGEYSFDLIKIAFPLYALGWIGGIYLNGGYERPTRIAQLLRGIFLGSIAIIVGYSLVSEQYRFSRAILLLGGVWAALSIPASRLILQKMTGIRLLTSTGKDKRVIIVGKPDEAERVEHMIEQAQDKVSYISFVNEPGGTIQSEKYTGSFDQLNEIVGVFEIDEVIFCARDISSNDIFRKMSDLNPTGVEIKIAPTESQFVIGSNSIDAQGSWYTIQFNDISKPSNRRAKRLLDISMAFLFLILSPLLIGFVENKGGYFKNMFRALWGSTTLVGYDTSVPVDHLPRLKAGILKTTEMMNTTRVDSSACNHLNQLYAKDYSVWSDLNFVVSNFKKLGQA
ncbi:MAG TPA: glycosyl transferase family 2 [Cryomorphaceae bacterium]|nr:glycosyl transferase family 2 [Owenweeksia sp.]HBF20000.1 glycosyl transferase family 2 [Cryomorphaceae bacterium]|tara:strand:- start:1624 stop:3585 length:1962 start_codon:yes stop_codon:yes gene_type:complete